MKYLNALNTIKGVGSGTIRQLYGFFQDAEAAWNAPAHDLELAGIGPALVKTIISSRETIEPDLEWAKLKRENIEILFFTDKSYPPLLKEIPSSPALLYIKGNVKCLDMPAIAIVGSRKLTPYGQQTAYHLAHDLSASGLCVVSGLAFGIDAIAHKATLDAHGKTIAVLGNSLDSKSIYPRNNFRLAQEIVAGGGLLLSEYPLGTMGGPGLFPARNRIIAGLTLGTIVVEAAEKSGSLITANCAVEFNREVFAVPGPIFSPQSEGTNTLIKKGAKTVTGISDVLEELRIPRKYQQPTQKESTELTAEEKTVANVLSLEPTHVDRIIKLTKLETSRTIATLAMLEIKGSVKNIGGQNYIRL